ncbi:MAG: MBL fold metallo-hydrolase [Burkholderiales bacterium]|nr:MBL fold metallo-hydrolase [Phycisphaerae bacterium]
MPEVRVDVISIGTLSRNLLWKETEPLRTPHATCTLVRVGKRNILVDPGLPGVAIAARLFERTGLKPDAIDTIFTTSARPAHRGGVAAFPNAKLLMHEIEQKTAIQQIEALLDETDEAADREIIQRELDQLAAYQHADDQLAPQVDLFPLFGYTAGTCGLLISTATQTILIATDAVPTREHLLAGQVLPGSADLEKAKESLQEVYEIADLIIPGHDNIFTNPRNFGG